LEEVDVNGLLDHSTPSALSLVIRDEAEGRIRRALASLPEKHRTVLVLRYYKRMSYSRIAEALDLPLSAVRVRIFRAKRFLRCNLRRSHRADNNLGRFHPIKSPQILDASTPAAIGSFHPMPASPGFYAARSSASS
jgi:hypothetical protein